MDKQLSRSDDASLLAEVIAWLDHPITKRCLEVGPHLMMSHPHLGVKVPEDFGAHCIDLWKRVRAAAAAPVSEQGFIDFEDYLLASAWSAEEEKPQNSPADYAHNAAIKFARIVERLYER